MILMLAVVLLGGVIFLLSSTRPRSENRKIVVTSPKATDITILRNDMCATFAHINTSTCVPPNGYVEQISIKGGQAVKKGDSMFRIRAKRLDANVGDVNAPLTASSTASRAVGQPDQGRGRPHDAVCPITA